MTVDDEHGDHCLSHPPPLVRQTLKSMFVMHRSRTDEQSDSGCEPGSTRRYARRTDEAVRPR
jgi:hypothetical protein